MSERVYLSFDRYDDEESLESALNGSKYKAFIEEFDNDVFRRILKYDDISMLEVGTSKEDLERVQGVVDALRQIYWLMYKESCE